MVSAFNSQKLMHFYVVYASIIIIAVCLIRALTDVVTDAISQSY